MDNLHWPLDTSRVDLSTFYGYPDALYRPWVRVNFVSSADGAVEVNGLTAPLGSPPDKRVFDTLRGLADVVLVGAGTARTERYGGAELPSHMTARRLRAGQGAVPPIAVVSASAKLDPEGPLFTDTAVPPIVLTTSAAARDKRELLRGAGADVAVVGDDRGVHVGEVLEQLNRRGLRRVLCEGGPHLLNTLVAADAVDELCLTIAPCIAGPGAGRIIAGAAMLPEPVPLELRALLTENDVLLLRYQVVKDTGRC